MHSKPRKRREGDLCPVCTPRYGIYWQVKIPFTLITQYRTQAIHSYTMGHPKAMNTKLWATTRQMELCQQSQATRGVKNRSAECCCKSLVAKSCLRRRLDIHLVKHWESMHRRPGGSLTKLGDRGLVSKSPLNSYRSAVVSAQKLRRRFLLRRAGSCNPILYPSCNGGFWSRVPLVRSQGIAQTGNPFF